MGTPLLLLWYKEVKVVRLLGVVLDGINPLALVRIVPERFWNWGVPALARVVDPEKDYVR